ncbi:MAG: [NiFe] hydrogenase metallocenter assembly protein HypE [Ignavibacteriae bacterium]|nr:MAG: [NiFe] hydrogenase metallocenter assembly protein HypE [Ignavibacteriota bacterium]
MEDKQTINERDFNLSCPIPISEYDTITIAHGGGGTLMHQLIQKMFLSQFDNQYLNLQHDGAILEIDSNKIAFSTDTYVVQPIFFPGGDIGELAVYGTVNDLAMCGAKPLFISLGFVLEEGLKVADLWKIILSIKKAAERSGVKIVTGDTKVVEHGKADKIFINTTGVGKIVAEISPLNCKVGDDIIISGKIAEHGIAIMSARSGLNFETSIQSDTAPLNHIIEKLIKNSDKIHVLRDPTRGGVASTLNEIASIADVGIEIYEEKIPIDEQVRGACEILGFDPLYVANEGKFIAFVDPQESEKVLAIIQSDPLGKDAQIIGKVVANHKKTVIMKTIIGSNRIVDMISGEQLPRIC